MNLEDITVGILAVTPEGAAKAFRDLSIAFYEDIGAYKNPNITMHMQPLISHVQNFGNRSEWELLVHKGINDLKNASANILWMPANSSHLAINQDSDFNMPFINMVDTSVEYLKNQSENTLVLGTTVSMSDQLYFNDADNMQNCFKPNDTDQEKLNDIIVKELVIGQMSDESRKFVLKLIDKHQKDNDIEKLFFACTELPCFFNENDFELPVNDSMRVSMHSVINTVKEML
jgi:aspartate/glutamate racemase